MHFLSKGMILFVFKSINVFRKKVHIPLLIIMLSAFTSFGQSSFQTSDAIHGKIYDQETGYGIAFVNIFNESNRTWEYSSERGEFTVWANPGDTLVFSAVGYLSMLVYANDTMYHKNIQIPMIQRSYELDQVTVIGLKDYQQFKQEILSMEIKQTAIDSSSEAINTFAEEPIKQAAQKKKEDDIMKREQGTIITLTKAIPTRAQRENRMYIEALEKQRQQYIINKKYNRYIVYELTGLEGDELTDFIAFCAFEPEYLLETIAYDIYEKIKELLVDFREYQKNPEAFTPQE